MKLTNQQLAEAIALYKHLMYHTEPCSGKSERPRFQRKRGLLSLARNFWGR